MKALDFAFRLLTGKPSPIARKRVQEHRSPLVATDLFPVRVIVSRAFLDTWEWKQARHAALVASDGRCQLCGRSKHDLPYGQYLNVDHVIPRRVRPDLALDVENLQVLCPDDNAGKANRIEDWRRKR